MICAVMAIIPAGCFQPKEPLVSVDLGQGSSVGRVHDPAPGEPDSQLNERELLQRELAKCQDRLAEKERKVDRLENELDKVKDECKDKCKRYEKEIERLKDKIKKMED
ncbi:MAG: hypothetical protein JW709_09180 [Sedimentisphaerales bacterium]|nr:hypothetical protein [Sedimentisphaerales bacterium]